MENIRVIKIMSLVICVFLFTGCKLSQTTPKPEEIEGPLKMPKALFLYHVYSGQSVELVSYLDEVGNIYTIDFTSKEVSLNWEELYERIDKSKDEIIGNVNEEQLKAMYQLFLQVPIESGKEENLIYTESTDDVVLGFHRWYGLRYDKKGEIEYILLNGEGDTAVENQDKTAQEIEDWLKDILVEYDLNSNW